MTGCPGGQTWIDVAEKDLPIVVNIAEIVVSIVASLSGNAEITPAALAIINEAVSVFSAGMQALQDAINAYKASPGQALLDKVVAALNAVEQDAPNVIKAIAQAPAGIISIITSAIGTAVSLIAAIEALIPTTVVTVWSGNKAAVPSAKRVNVKGVKLPDAQVVKSNFNAVLSVYGYGQYQVK